MLCIIIGEGNHANETKFVNDTSIDVNRANSRLSNKGA